MGIGTARAGLAPEDVSEHVVRLCRILQGSKELRIGAELPEPMPKLHERGHSGSCQGSPAGLPTLHGVGIHPQLLGESLLAQAAD